MATRIDRGLQALRRAEAPERGAERSEALGSPRGTAVTIALTLVLAIAASSACGGSAAFQLSADENNSYALREALVKRDLPSSPRPTNSAATPRVFAVAAGSPKTIVAFDLASGTARWKIDADVQSRIHVGGDFIVAVEGKQLVARDQDRGATRWAVLPDGDIVGAAADRERAYLVVKRGNQWWLSAFDGRDGKRLWRADAGGQLGAPAAHGGVVYAPFLNQWLTIIDGRTGKQLTRIRGIDEQISTLRVTSQVAYYGSKRGMFRLDERSASGRRDEATYGHVKIPSQLERTTYGRDAYDPVHQNYTAADRARVLWSSEASSAGPMKLAGDGYAIHYFRYVLGFGLDGEIRWAYSHPRVELVASEHTGVVIAAVAQNGDIVAIDPHSGAIVGRHSLGLGSVIGATFDADGWAPAGERESLATVGALLQIVRDRDARFDRVKELAATTLARTPGPDVTRELLALLSDPRQPPHLKEHVVDLLSKRRDASSLPVLIEQLAVKTDVLVGTRPEALGAVAKAIGGLRDVALDDAVARDALQALETHLDHGATETTDLPAVIGAMNAVGRGAERPALSSHLLLYHADDRRGGDAAWQAAIVRGLLANAGPSERALLRHVAADPRSKPGLVKEIQAGLGPD